jgi:RHS repeat-associated protein
MEPGAPPDARRAAAHSKLGCALAGFASPTGQQMQSRRTVSRRARVYGLYDTANRLVSGLIGSGSPQYVYGYDHASNLTTITPNGPPQSFSYTSTNTITSGTYDANGSPTLLSGVSYKWDGENRLVLLTNIGNNTGSSFTYDGLGRLVRVVDTHNGAITADHSYTWCGSSVCLAHDNTQSGSPVSTQYFAQGIMVGSTPYYYVKDSLGSVTQLITVTGAVASQYSYDAYGNRTVVSGTMVSDIGFGGYFYHGASGLDFTLHRAYDSVHARWLNRDPIGEYGGVNLYRYVRDNPLEYTDPTGKFEVVIIIVPVVAVTVGLVCYIKGTSKCEKMFPNHRDIESPDFRGFMKCTTGVAGVIGRGMGLSSDPLGGGASAAGEAGR